MFLLFGYTHTHKYKYSFFFFFLAEKKWGHGVADLQETLNKRTRKWNLCIWLDKYLKL